jgi:hypothetical protein
VKRLSLLSPLGVRTLVPEKNGGPLIANDHLRVARFFLVQYTKSFKNIPNKYKNTPNGHKTYQMTAKYTKWPQNLPNGHKIYQMTAKYTKWP